jgi:hypothetical protein
MFSLRSFFSLGLLQTPRRRFVLLVSAVLLALLGAGFAWWAAWRGRPALSYHFVPGQRLTFDLEYLSAAAVDLGRSHDGKDVGAAGLSRSAHASVRGELVVTVLGTEGECVWLAYGLSRPTVRLAIDGQLDVAVGEALEADLQQALFVQADPRGRILYVNGRPGRTSVSSTFQRAVLAATQVVLPGSTVEEAPSWEVEEDDLNSTAVVRYEVEAGSAPRGGGVCSLRKARLRYCSVRHAGEDEQAEALEYLPEGGLEATVDVRGQHLLSLEGTEITTTRARGQVVGRTENTIWLRFLRVQTVSAAEQRNLEAEEMALARVSPGRRLSAGPSPEEAEASIQVAELGEATADSLLAELARAESGTGAALGETALYLKFKALVYLRPDTSARLGKRLAEASVKSVAMRVLPQALAHSGRPEAQAALAEVVRARRNDWPALAELLPALGMAKAPTRVLEDTLFELASASHHDIRTTAELALGTLAHSLALSDPARAGGIVRWALARLEDVRSAAERRQMLLVLGNAGSPRALLAVRRYLNASEPEVRGAAVAALRWLPGAEVADAMCQALTGDADAGVRLEAAQALAVRPMNAVKLRAHASALREDRSAAVRLAVLKNVGRAREALAGAVELVREAAAKDPDQEVRAAAAELLEEEG